MRRRQRRRASYWSPVHDVLSTVLKRVGAARELAGYRVWTFWDAEVGETIAKNAQPAHFRDGVLVVNVTSHTWIQELQFMKESIRQKLNTRLGEDIIRDIYFASGKVAPAPAPPQPATRRLPPGNPVVEVPAIDNSAVRDAFSGLLDARARRIVASRKRDD